MTRPSRCTCTAPRGYIKHIADVHRGETAWFPEIRRRDVHWHGPVVVTRVADAPRGGFVVEWQPRSGADSRPLLLIPAATAMHGARVMEPAE